MDTAAAGIVHIVARLTQGGTVAIQWRHELESALEEARTAGVR